MFKAVRVLLFLIVPLFYAAEILAVPDSPFYGPNFIRVPYTWTFRGKTFSIEVTIPRRLYDVCMHDVQRRAAFGSDYSFYVTNNKDNHILQAILDQLEEDAARCGFSELDKVNFILSFVQSLYYSSDRLIGYDEYPRYPIETLVEGGDCEDKAILAAALLYQMGYRVVLILFPGHAAVGIRWDQFIPNARYYWVDGHRYYYLETTTPSWEIGQIPPALRELTPQRIIRVNPKPLLTIDDWEANPVDWDSQFAEYNIMLVLTNLGTSSSLDTQCSLALDPSPGVVLYLYNVSPGGFVQGRRFSNPFTIPPGESRRVSFRVKCARGRETRLLFRAWSSNHTLIELVSEPFVP